MNVTHSVDRLKREDCVRTKHDAVFSQWQILIGPFDWEEHSSGKEGIARYRIYNLPINCSCPGIYELGVAAICSNSGREVRKLDPKLIIPVYLGQAENVRTRLQHYGRAGSHLDYSNSCDGLEKCNHSSQRGPALFKDIFSKGYPLAFRWVAIRNKMEAEKIEAQLLRTFDYAWNKGGNGVRRSDDILLKLEKMTSIPLALQKWKWWPILGSKKGININESLPSTQIESSSNILGYNLIANIFKLGRSRPHVVSYSNNINGQTHCGVALGDGSVCTQEPVPGRRRCAKHKGKRINGSNISLLSKKEPISLKETVDLHLNTEQINNYRKIPPFERNMCDVKETRPETTKEETWVNETLVCGIVLEDGICMNLPIPGRKRCKLHKGRRIKKSNISLKFMTRKCSQSETPSCGVRLEDGSFCTKALVHGRKRCQVHKGRRVT